MPYAEFGCRATAIGSLPHTDPAAAVALVRRYLKDFPAWPQLPRRDFRENMYVQYSEGFPGVTVRDGRMFINTSRDLSQPLERLYAAYLQNDADSYPVTEGYAAGLYRFLAQTDISPRAVKGQITGPLTWGLTVTDQDRRAILHNEVLGDAVARLLRLKAAWQEKELRRLCPQTMIFIDEPYMSAYGSSTASGAFASAERVAGMLGEVFSGIRGWKGLHCCGNTDWPLLLQTGLDILSFDTYNFAASLALYPAEVAGFLKRGGAVAWGIVPNEAAALARETAASLQDRLEAAMAPFTRHGISFRDIIAGSLLTPCCGLAGLTEAAAERALELLAELSARIRQHYG